MKNLIIENSNPAAYTRNDMFNDGILIDVTSQARKVGLKYPVALHMDLYSKIDDQIYQTRLNEILTQLFTLLKKRKGRNIAEIYFEMAYVTYDCNGKIILNKYLSILAITDFVEGGFTTTLFIKI